MKITSISYVASIVAMLFSSTANAHYANMGLDGVGCFIYDDIKGTPQGDMIVRKSDGTWYDHDDPSRNGTITYIPNQAAYDSLAVKTKIGIVCAPEDVDTTDIGIPYVEMEPTDEDFYSNETTVFEEVKLAKRFQITCIIRFCRNTEK